ncbi:hypothetical protein AB3S75_010815 [Citrus x aurantiifolia]
MDHNQFEGKIPEEMSRFQNLQFLDMRHNQLSGEIPSSFGNLSSLVELKLNNNNLSGVIPSSLGNLKQLALLHLFQNDLSGAIPEEIFNISHMSDSLNFARNHLVGSIPPKIGNLKVLRMFVVSSNNLSGEIPSEIGSCFYLQEIYMAENFFRGSIPSSLGSLKDLREIDLSQNNLSGKIPISLERLPLEYLNLSFNDLEGQVPTKGIFANASAISVSGNSNRLCGGIPELQLPKCPENNSRNHKISRGALKVIISTCSVFSGLLLVSFFIFYWLRRRGESGKEPSEPILRRALRKVSYESLLKATDGFSSTHLIGIGSFGSVYKGTFDRDGTIVAIKVLNLQLGGASKSFAAECRALRNIRHRNLVRVITSCSSIDFQGNDFKALVYEYMPNGSLENWLHPDAIPQTDEENDEIRNLTLLERISIAIDVASALDYLHHHCQEPTIHCDLKPSNILLDNNLTAHVGDFGLARLRQEVPNNQSSSVGVRGTIGYAAPEYGLGSEVTAKGDVYSYGILLLEMVTGKKPTDIMFEGDLNLHNFARMALPDHVMDIVDLTLINDDGDLDTSSNQRLQQARLNCKIECLSSMVKIGVACSMASPQDRMNTTNVVHELQSVKNILLEHETMFNRQRALALGGTILPAFTGIGLIVLALNTVSKLRMVSATF